jgi:hypothetical protein
LSTLLTTIQKTSGKDAHHCAKLLGVMSQATYTAYACYAFPTDTSTKVFDFRSMVGGTAGVTASATTMGSGEEF